MSAFIDDYFLKFGFHVLDDPLAMIRWDDLVYFTV